MITLSGESNTTPGDEPSLRKNMPSGENKTKPGDVPSLRRSNASSTPTTLPEDVPSLRMTASMTAAEQAVRHLNLNTETDLIYNPRTCLYEDLGETIAVPDTDDEFDKPKALEAARRRIIVHRNPDDAIPYKPRPQLRSLSPLPYRPGPNLRRPEKKKEPKKKTPEPIVYVSTPEDGEVRLYRGDRCAFMRSVGTQKTGRWKTRPKSPSKVEEGKIIIPTKYRQEAEERRSVDWAQQMVEKGYRTDPKNFKTPDHWMAISEEIAKESKKLPPFSRGLPYPTELHGFPPAEYRAAVDDNRPPISSAAAALDDRDEPPQDSIGVGPSNNSRKHPWWMSSDDEDNSKVPKSNFNSPTVPCDPPASRAESPRMVKKVPSLMDLHIPRPDCIPPMAYYTRNPFAPRLPVKRASKPGCWNCESLGHGYSDCEEPKRKFCYRCGAPGRDVNTCPHCLAQAYPPPHSREGETEPRLMADSKVVEASEARQITPESTASQQPEEQKEGPATEDIPILRHRKRQQ